MREGRCFWDPTAETLPRPELERLQVERLRACVERLARSDNSVYRSRLGELEPDRFRSLDDLQRLPFTTKDDLRNGYPFGLLAAPLSDVVRLHASSGTTGRATVVGYTRADLDLWADLMARGLVAGGMTEADVFQNAYGYGLFTGGLGFHDGATRIGAAVVPTSSGNTPRQVTLMRDLGVTAFGATPSYSIHLVEVAIAEGIDPVSLPLRAGFLGAEPMSDQLRREIEERMDVTVFEQYGLSEVIGPGVAAACHLGQGMHIWEDHFIPEVIDPETGERVPDGEIGELVLSAPTKAALPILRYRTRDRTWLIREPCPCGRTSVRIPRIVGRTDDMLIVRGVNVFPSQIEHTLLGIAGLEPHYQIVLETRVDRQDALRVRIEVAAHVAAEPGGPAALATRAGEQLRRELGIGVLVELLPPRTLQRSEGKAVRVIDKRVT